MKTILSIIPLILIMLIGCKNQSLSEDENLQLEKFTKTYNGTLIK